MSKSKFREMADRDKAMFSDELGESLTLKPDGGSPAEVIAILLEDDGSGMVGSDGNQIGKRVAWMIDPDDLAAPKDKYDEIKIDGVVYTLDNHRREGSWWRCEFTSTQKTQFSSEKLHAGTT